MPLEEDISNNVDFILSHFPQPIFPRTISTYKTQMKQFEVFSKEEMLKGFEESAFVDCRVNGYPSYTQYKGIQRYPPNFIFVDLDLSTLKSTYNLKKALSASLRIIKDKKGHPTVLFTGNGFHIYQPIKAVIFEEYEEFAKFTNPSTKFLRFAEDHLTDGMSDPAHSPSFKSCMIRVPGSLNSKCSEGNNEIKIIQAWDGFRPPIGLLSGIFHAYLVNEKIKEMELQKSLEKIYGPNVRKEQNRIIWIEHLLNTPIDDYRKNTIALILAPYLVNIKKNSFHDSFVIIKNWLDGCHQLRNLDSNFDYKIKYSLNTSMTKFQLPMKFSTLEKKNKKLHYILEQKIKKVVPNEHG